MQVYELTIKVYLSENILYKNMYYELSQVIDKTLSSNSKFLELHNKNCFKNYCFNGLYPLESDRIYKVDGIYSFQIRTIDKELFEFLSNRMSNIFTSKIKVLKIDIKIIKKKHIAKIYSITSVTMKTDNGYWKGNITLEQYESKLRSNLYKKYRDFTGEDIDESYPIFNSIEFKNIKPVSFEYKSINLLGDKISLNIADDEISQKIAYKDTYVLADGTYIIIKPTKDGSLESVFKVDIKLDKKTRDIDRTIENIDLLINLDYNSKLIDMDKPMGGKKKIHSNNYLSFFVKKDSLILDDKGKRKLTEEIIDNYYKILENPMVIYEKNRKAKEIYEAIEEKLGKVDNLKLNEIRTWIMENNYDLEIDLSKSDYLKIFFLYDEKDFEVEYERYLLPNIFNNNDFNVKIDGETLGLPNNNMGLNAKKPYLENKTRKIRVPVLMNQEDILFLTIFIS